jgi:hypothetical protein
VNGDSAVRTRRMKSGNPAPKRHVKPDSIEQLTRACDPRHGKDHVLDANLKYSAYPEGRAVISIRASLHTR